MKNRKYHAFTLVEMLIVMGILSVLMAIGVSVARFAILRANNIQHQNAVDQMYQALQSYYTDNRRYPRVTAPGTIFGTNGDAFEDALNGGVLDEYVDSNFDGGSPAVFYYMAADTTAPQSFMTCVSFADADANTPADNLGGYCNGNGFGDNDLTCNGNTIDQKVFDDGVATGWGTNVPTWADFLTDCASEWVSDYWNGTEWSNP